jgi:hypothetical protein
VSAHSAGAYTATLLAMVNVMKGVGVHPPPSPAWANFTLMMEYTPESSRCNSVCSVDVPICMCCVATARQTVYYIHCKKRFATFLSPAGMSLAKLSQGGNNLIIPALGSLVSDIPALGGNVVNLFLQCRPNSWTKSRQKS